MSSFDYDIIECCEFYPLSEELAALPFYCGDSEDDKDLEDFFHKGLKNDLVRHIASLTIMVTTHR